MSTPRTVRRHRTDTTGDTAMRFTRRRTTPPPAATLANLDALDVPLWQAGEVAQARLVALAEAHVNDHRRPCCDADTTLRDWVEAGFTTS